MSFPRYFCLLTAFLITATCWSQQRKAPQFIPGERDIFTDSLWNAAFGEPPSRWVTTRGGVETMLMEDRPVIGFIDKITDIEPKIDQEEYLPKTFTIELEVYFHNMGNEGYTIEFNGGAFVFRISRDGISYRPGFPRTEVEKMVGWRKIQVAVNGRSLKVFYNGDRLVNHSDMGIDPTRLNLHVLSHNTGKDRYAMVRNIRIAEGGGTLYERFESTGVLELNNIHFDLNEATLRPEAEPVIQRIAKMLETHPELQVQIEGHTDSSGDAASNLALSERRAQAVQQRLIELGIAEDRMRTVGYGEEKPLSPGLDAQSMAINRRVTLRRL